MRHAIPLLSPLLFFAACQGTITTSGFDADGDAPPAAELVPTIIEGRLGPGLGKELGQFSSVAVDSNGYPHISYWGGYDNHDLRYAFYDGSTWHTQVVDASGYVGQHTSLALDGSNRPHISYYGDTNLKYASFDGSAWQTETLDSRQPDGSSGWEGKYTALTLDKDGQPYIAYALNWAEYTFGVRVTNRSGGEWTTDTIEYRHVGGESIPDPMHPGGVMDPTGRNRWSVRHYRDVAIAFDKSDVLHVSYYSPLDRRIKHAQRVAGVWSIEQLGIPGGQHQSLAIDKDNNVCLAHTDGISLQFTCANDGEWQTEIVDEDGAVGWYGRLVFNATGVPYISYYDFSNRRLKLAWKDASVWRNTVLDADGDVGSYSSLALHGANTAYLSYHDASSGSLRYLKADLTQVGASPALPTMTQETRSDGVTITDSQTWTNRIVKIAGNVVVTSGGHLTLNRSVIQLQGDNSIEVHAGATFSIVNNSVIDAFGWEAGLYVGNVDNPLFETFVGGEIVATDSAFLNLKEIYVNRSAGHNEFTRCYFRDFRGIRGGIVFLFSQGDVVDSVALNMGFVTYNRSADGKYLRNLTRDVLSSVYTAISSNIVANDSITEDITEYANFDFGIHGTYYYHIRGNLFVNSRAGVIVNGDNEHGLVENNAGLYSDPAFGLRGGVTGGFGPGNYSNDNNVFRNSVEQYGVGLPQIAGGEPRGGWVFSTNPDNNPFYQSRNVGNLSYGLTAEKRAFNGESGVKQHSWVLDSAFGGTSAGAGIIVRASKTLSMPGPIPETSNWDNLYANLRLDSFKWGILSAYGIDLRFVDITLSNISGDDIHFKGHNQDLKFINLNYRADRVAFDDAVDVFEPHWYADIKVIDQAGKPVAGAAVVIVNEVDPRLGSINRLGQRKASFSTNADGHTPLPVPYKKENIVFDPPIQYDANGDLVLLPAGQWHSWSLRDSTDADTIVLLDYSQTKETKTDYSYSITASNGAGTKTITGVDPDPSWYRADPSVSSKTLTIQLP